MNKSVLCPVCGFIMDKYIYDYNTDTSDKTDYKCPECGHKMTLVKNEDN